MIGYISMMQKDLAAALGISPAMVSRLAKRGMPTDSLERAQKWRRKNLPMARMKGNRADTVAMSKAGSGPTRSPAANADDEAVERVSRLMGMAAAALAVDQLALIKAELRDAMCCVPQHRRAGCLLDSDVMDALTREVAEALRDDADDASTDATPESDTLSGVELDAMGSFWYQVAAGEVIVSADL